MPNDNFYASTTLAYEFHLHTFLLIYNSFGQGIKDKHVAERTYHGSSKAEEKRVSAFLVTCYRNLALSYLRSRSFKVAIAACNLALDIDARCTDALYSRARARILPKSSGAVEMDMAIKDLQTAIAIDPANRTVRCVR